MGAGGDEAATVEAVHQRVRFLAAAGIKPDEIGWRVGFSTNEVKAIVAGRSVKTLELGPRHDGDGKGVHPMWGWPEAYRRVAFYELAREGAKKTLQEQFGR